MSLLLRGLLGVVAAAVTAWGFWVPGAEGFMQPDLARIVFFHLPCALLSTAFLIWGAIASWKSLRSDPLVWDPRARSAMEMALVLGALTLVTGMIFSAVQWGTWWEWREVRMTSFLLVELILAAYFALRAGYREDRVAQARVGAVYVMAALLPVLLLVFVAPRLEAFRSLHPDVVRQGGLSPLYRAVFLSTLGTLAVVCVWIYRLGVRVTRAELALELKDAELADRNDSSHRRVARPVGDGGSNREAAEGPGG